MRCPTKEKASGTKQKAGVGTKQKAGARTKQKTGAGAKQKARVGTTDLRDWIKPKPNLSNSPIEFNNESLGEVSIDLDGDSNNRLNRSTNNAIDNSDSNRIVKPNSKLKALSNDDDIKTPKLILRNSSNKRLKTW